MATVEEAIELLRDPAYRARQTAYCGARFVEVRAQDVINELRAKDAADEATARALAVKALREIGGVVHVERHPAGHQQGRDRVQFVDHFCVPVAKLS
jgi:hypothetical protein